MNLMNKVEAEKLRSGRRALSNDELNAISGGSSSSNSSGSGIKNIGTIVAHSVENMIENMMKMQAKH